MATSNENAKNDCWSVSMELQEWDHLSGDAVATGVDCVAPSMDPSTVNVVHHEIVEDEDVGSGGDDDDDEDTFSVYTQYSSCLEDPETQENTFFQVFRNEVHEQDISALNKCESSKQSLRSTKKSTMMKRRRRELTWDAMFMEFITQNIAFQQRVLQILESDVSSANECSKFSIHAAISVINRMVDRGLLTEGSKLWLFAMDLFEDGVKREVFISLPDDDGRLAWLLYKQKISET